jgi:hypothetical protein
VLLLTVLGFGSSILRINDVAPGENQYGHEYSAAVILNAKVRGGVLVLHEPSNCVNQQYWGDNNICRNTQFKRSWYLFIQAWKVIFLKGKVTSH